MVTCKMCYAASTDDETHLCSFCRPNECLDCEASYVYYTDGYFRCSHGCEYSVNEYMSKRFLTEILNSPPHRKLAFGGPRIECIIPEGTDIVTHEQPVSTRNDSITLIHYTEHKKKILNNGFKFPPHSHCKTKESNNSEDLSIRKNAAYAWPYKSEVCENKLSWEHPFIFLEVPEENVRVSSYTFLESVSENHSEHKYTIPLEKYESELVFEPKVLRKACSEFGRPVEREQLLF